MSNRVVFGTADEHWGDWEVNVSLSGVNHPEGFNKEVGCHYCVFNKKYTVFIRIQQDGREGYHSMIHLSIKRNDKKPIREWRDLLRIKNTLVGEEVEAVELFPAMSRLIDEANQYHLWCIPNYTFPFGSKEPMVTDRTGYSFPEGLVVPDLPFKQRLIPDWMRQSLDKRKGE
jgi:hypothetical protein